LGLNLSHPHQKEVTESLIRWADVMIESFSVGVKEKWGLSYDEVKIINPEIIMLSTTAQGQTGPHCRHPAWGWSMKNMCGFTHLTGWPDRDGTAPAPSYTDQVSPWLGLVAILAAMDYRRRTGSGQFIDLSQVESSLHSIAPAILNFSANGRNQARQGNTIPGAAPHGCYRCLGEDRWCVIAIFTDEEWQSLCRAIGDPAWTSDSRFATFLGRKHNEQELDMLLGEWTVQHTPREVMDLLQSAGVAAGVVQDGEDLMDGDSHIKFRQHFLNVDHPVMGKHRAMGFPVKFSESRTQSKHAPCLGEHTEYVCTSLLGMSSERFIELLESNLFV
jgi:benzylsuccinate CoA-transferase BbsF subunit